MASQMTAREQRFAALLLETTKVDAYKQAGYSQKGSRATRTVDAYRLSKRPKVQREVARLLQQRAFPADDYRQLQATAIAGLTEMFLYDADSRVRLKAASILLAYADAGLRLHLEPSAKERAYDQLTQHIEDSARKHREAMGREREQALIVEPAEEGEPLVEVAAEAEPARAEDQAPEPDAPDTVEASLVAEKLNPAVQFRRERIPGYFPARYRRVPIEP